eukprot:3994514-Karenia_brevis.AAC.1
MAKTWFVNNFKLQEARMKVNSLKKQTSSMPGMVWLDVAKTDEELRPRRALFRGMEYLVNEAYKGDDCKGVAVRGNKLVVNEWPIA